MRFFTRAAPTVLPCAARGGPIGTGRTTTDPRDARRPRAGSIDPTGPGRPTAGPDRAAPETPWEF